MKRILLSLLMILMAFAPLHAQDDETQDILDDLLSEFVSQDTAAVTVQITSPDGEWSAAIGLAEGFRAAVPSDRFRIGSMSKTFLAVTALMLVEDGVFTLDDSAATWLPAEIVEHIDNADTVTLRQLLSMRSGIEDYLETDDFWEAMADDTTYPWTAAEALTYAYGLPAMFAPDAEFYYSNSNYLLLQLVLENATGKPLHTLIRERILDPLNMTDTYTQVMETLPGGFVHGYEDFDGDGVVNEVSGINDGAGLGDGGLISTVADLTIFYRALLEDETLLNPDSLDALLDFQADDEDGGYSLGFSEWETEAGTAWGHSGAVVGFQSVGLYLPDEETTIMILAASADLDPEELAEAIIEEFIGE